MVTLELKLIEIVFDIEGRTPNKDWSRDCMGQS